VSDTVIIPVHQWTNDGDEVLVVRFASKDGKSYNNFQHPMTVGETVTAPDWVANCNCGSGIHGWPWALGLGEGKECDWTALWQVYGVKPEDIMQGEPDLVGKIKFHTGVLRFLGTWEQAINFVLDGQMAWVYQAASGAASATGARGAASATGWSGAASATGESGAASATGARGAASATGARGAASATGESGAASATGESGAASATGASGAASATGKDGTAIALGINGKASGSLGNFLVVAEWKITAGAWKRVAMGKVRVDGKRIKADTFYSLKNGKWTIHP
jgi:hypothetical protein